MYRGKRILGVVPARGGSKGLPHKNIRPLLKKPLLAWTLDAAKASNYLDRVIVSTDDHAIANVVRKHGGEVPFMRPAELAQDETSSIDVMVHAISWLKDQGDLFDYVIMLEPTSPLRETADIDQALEQLISHPQAKAIVSVTRLEGDHPEFHVVVDPASRCIRRPNGSSTFKILRRQDLDDMYFFEGTLYISEVAAFMKRRTFYHELTLPYIVPRWKSPEIDELQDFITVEALLKARMKGLL